MKTTLAPLPLHIFKSSDVFWCGNNLLRILRDQMAESLPSGVYMTNKNLRRAQPTTVLLSWMRLPVGSAMEQVAATDLQGRSALKAYQAHTFGC